MKKEFLKNEKGAITLYVLLVCLFFLFVLSGIYTLNLNKMQAQEESLRQIQENYSTVTIFEKEVNINELCVKGKKRKVEIKKA